jgi:hypothetical protein
MIFAEDSLYVKQNSSERWANSSDNRLIYIVNHPTEFRLEEYVGALHEYATRHGVSDNAMSSLDFLIKSYIEHNPNYASQSTGDVFVQTARVRGVSSLQGAEISPDEIDEAIIETILKEAAKEEAALEIKEEGINADGSTFVMYQASKNIERTIITRTNGETYIRENITSPDSFNEAIAKYTRIYTEPVPYFKGGYEAHVTEPPESLADMGVTSYKGTITLAGSQMFAREIRPESGVITQKQWCTLRYFNKCTEELGAGWGFIASWDDETGVSIQDDADDTIQNIDFSH